MPNDAEQPTDRAGRRTLVILLVVAAIGVGLWFALERPKLAELRSDATSAAGDAQTAVAGEDSTAGQEQTAVTGEGSTAGDAQAAGSGATSAAADVQTTRAGEDSTAGEAQTTGAGATSTAGDAQTTLAGATSTAGDAQTTRADEDSTAGEAQTTLAGATSAAGDAQTTLAGVTSPAGDAHATLSGTTSPAGDVRTDGTGTGVSQDPTLPANPDATDDATRVAAVEPGTASVDEAPRVSAAPDSAIEKTPVDAPSDAETTGEAGVLAAVERVIDKIETAIEERLDSELQVSVTYDDSQADAPQAEGAPEQATETAAPTPALATGGVRIPDSDVGADKTVAGSTGSGGAAPSDATTRDVATADVAMAGDSTATTVTGSTEAEAKEYVETLTDTAPQTIPVDKADHFVTPERVISLVPQDTIENVSVDELAGDETLSPDTPITVVREVEQVEIAAAEQLIADSGGDLDKEVRVQVTYDDAQDESAPNVVEEDDVQRITVREALERIRTEPDKPLPVIRTVRHFEVMTLKELLEGAASEDAFLSVVTRPYRIESATLADLLERQQAENPGSIFYLHTVLPTDVQGIWGIVHFGIIDNFARGMAIRRGEDIETYTVRIPRDADERLADRSSSFLGLMIDRKTKESYVYNFRDNRMGRNPDRIFPGQELVIISFQPEELMSIYKHFAAS